MSATPRARAEQALLLAMFQNAADADVFLTPADTQEASEIARRVAAAWTPEDPLMALYPAERGADGRIRWDRTGRVVRP